MKHSDYKQPSVAARACALIFIIAVACGGIHFVNHMFDPPKPEEPASSQPIYASSGGSSAQAETVTEPKDDIIVYSEDKPDASVIARYKEVKNILDQKGVDFCELNKSVNDLVHKSYKIGEDRYPINATRADKYGNQWFERELKALLKDNGIPYNVGSDILMLGRHFCPGMYQ